MRRRELVQAGWPHGAIVHENTLDAYVARLRRKLRGSAGAPEIVDRARRRLPDRMSTARPAQRRLLLAVVVAVAVALLALVAGFNLLLGQPARPRRPRPRRGPARRRSSTRCRIDHGRLGVARGARRPRARTPTSGSSPAAARSSSPGSDAAIDRAAHALAGGAGAASSTSRRPTRGSTPRPSIDGGRRLGTVVAGVSLAPYEQTRKLALIGSLILAACVLLLVALASRWLLGASLRPVVADDRQAAEWSEHDLDQRFALGAPHDELTELAATLDGLLDRLAASLRHEQRFSAELSHELRTPLARVMRRGRARAPPRRDAGRVPAGARADPAKRRPARAHGRRARRRGAHEAGDERGTADAYAVAAERRARVRGSRPSGRSRVEVDAPTDRFASASTATSPSGSSSRCVENACRYGATSVRVAIGRENSSVVYTVEDDGPGVTADERERIFEPGRPRQRPRAGDGAGAGLGLALARGSPRSVDGDVVAERRPDGGRFLVRLPSG